MASLRKRNSTGGNDEEVVDAENPQVTVTVNNVAEVLGAAQGFAADPGIPSPTTSKSHPAFEDETECADDEEFASPLWINNYEKTPLSASSFFPPLTWVPAYFRSCFGRPTKEDTDLQGGLAFSVQGDLIAGLTVGFMLVPQCLAFALLAGLPIQAGLYSSFLPLVVYALFGTIRQVQPGPTALMSLITGQALDGLGLETGEERMAGAALIAVFVGGISVVLGMVRFGFIVDFMSHSVMAAFCSAAGVTIGTSQLKHLLGITMARKKYWWQTAGHLITHLDEVHGATFAIGGTLLFVLLFMKQWKSAGSEDKRKKHLLWRWLPTKKTSTPFRVLKFVADLSSLGAVLVGWFWGLVYRTAEIEGVKYVGKVDDAALHFKLPGEGLNDIQFDSVIVSALVMAVVGYLETMAVGGKFAMAARYNYEPNQELLALGLSNIASAFMSGYPCTGSFSRTAVNAMLGATSLFSCALSSSLVLMAVLFLLPVIEHLPLASLAPIIIQGAIGVVTVHDFFVAFKASKAEFAVMLATFTVSLALTVKEGLLVGFVLSILKTMNDLANPNLAVCGRLPDKSFRDLRNFPKAEIIPTAVVVRMDARLSFANSRKMKEFCIRAVQVRASQGDTVQYLIIDAKSVNHVDLTGCEMLEMLAESLKSQNQSLIVANLKGPASKCLTSAHVPQALEKYGGHLCIDMEQALDIVNGHTDQVARSKESVKELVKRVETAQKLIRNANTSAFYACSGAKDGCMSGKHESPKPTGSSNTPTGTWSLSPETATPEIAISEFSRQSSPDQPESIDEIADEGATVRQL